MNTGTVTPGTRSHSTPAPGGTSMCRVESSTSSSIVITLTLLWAVENLPTPIPNPGGPRDQYKFTPNTSYWNGSETDEVGIGTAVCVYISTNGLRQSQHPLIWSLRHDVSCVWKRLPPGALHVEQKAVYDWKRLGDSELCNTMRFESNSWSPTLADTRYLLEHLVLAMGPNSRFGSGSCPYLAPDDGNGLYHTKNPDHCNWAGFPPTSRYFNLKAWARNKYLSSDRIVTCSRCILCSFTSSFTSRIHICDPTIIRWVALKKQEFLFAMWCHFIAI